MDQAKQRANGDNGNGNGNGMRYVTYQWFISTVLVLLAVLCAAGAVAYYPKADGAAIEQKVCSLKEGQTEIKVMIRELAHKIDTRGE